MRVTSDDLLRDIPGAPPVSTPPVFPTFDEYCDNFGFSWIKAPLELDQGSGGNNSRLGHSPDGKESDNTTVHEAGKKSMQEQEQRGVGGQLQACPYQQQLEADSVFHNPVALDLMLKAYSLPPHLSFTVHPLTSPELTTLTQGSSADGGGGGGDKWDYFSLQERRHDFMSEEFTEKVNGGILIIMRYINIYSMQPNLTVLYLKCVSVSVLFNPLGNTKNGCSYPCDPSRPISTTH